MNSPERTDGLGYRTSTGKTPGPLPLKRFGIPMTGAMIETCLRRDSVVCPRRREVNFQAREFYTKLTTSDVGMQRRAPKRSSGCCVDGADMLLGTVEHLKLFPVMKCCSVRRKVRAKDHRFTVTTSRWSALTAM